MCFLLRSKIKPVKFNRLKNIQKLVAIFNLKSYILDLSYALKMWKAIINFTLVKERKIFFNLKQSETCFYQ